MFDMVPNQPLLPSYRNQTKNCQIKPHDWFLYGGNVFLNGGNSFASRTSVKNNEIQDFLCHHTYNAYKNATKNFSEGFGKALLRNCPNCNCYRLTELYPRCFVQKFSNPFRRALHRIYSILEYQKLPAEVFYNKAVLKHFVKLTGVFF